MTTVWPLPRIEFRELSSVTETRPTAYHPLVGCWSIPQFAPYSAEPHKADQL
jgi:hypothetical protein